MFNRIFLSILLFSGATLTYAEAGYRVCSVLNQSDMRTGLVVKIAKENKDDTCSKKVNFMRSYYGNAYPGQQATFDTRLMTCEDFSQGSIRGQGDFCKSMQVNKIYKYTVKTQNTEAGVKFWHN